MHETHTINSGPLLRMERSTFNRFRELIYANSGIRLADSKEALVSARLAKRMRALGIEEHRQYLCYVREDQSGKEIIQLLDAISTNVTSFFRAPEHFDVLGQEVARWAAAGQERFRFWSAACSTGEEPVSMAITILENLMGPVSENSRILATDICTEVLEVARIGVYPTAKVEALPRRVRTRYMERVPGLEKDKRISVAPIRKMIHYRRLNLSTPPFPMPGPLDAVFCRNVMIYFSHDVRQQLLDEVHRLLKPEGLLFVGHAESLSGMDSRFRPVQPSVYRKSNR